MNQGGGFGGWVGEGILCWAECEAAAYWCLRSAKGNAVHDAGVDDAAT